MIEELEQLSLALSQISTVQAKRVASVVNDKIVKLVDAQVAKLYWSSEAQNGVLLTPVAFVNREKQFADPMPFQITESDRGILSYVREIRKPVWLERLTEQDLTTTPVMNKYTEERVPREHLDMGPYPWFDSMMVVPLMIRGEVRGFYDVELRASGRLTRGILELLVRIGKPLAAVLWDADTYSYNEHRTDKVVSQFINSTASFSFDEVLLETDQRSGFIARPFDAQFSDVESRIAHHLNSKRIRARAYQPEGGQGYIIDEIQRQIRNSHFCIADLTGLKPNVMTEVGMMMVLKKHFLLLRKRGDSATIPFDVSHIPLYDYQTRPGESGLQVWNVANSRFESFDVVLDKFIQRLPPETGFFSAPAAH